MFVIGFKTNDFIEINRSSLFSSHMWRSKFNVQFEINMLKTMTLEYSGDLYLKATMSTVEHPA